MSKRRASSSVSFGAKRDFALKGPFVLSASRARAKQSQGTVVARIDSVFIIALFV